MDFDQNWPKLNFVKKALDQLGDQYKGILRPQITWKHTKNYQKRFPQNQPKMGKSMKYTPWFLAKIDQN